jgi:hypothetical protein
MERIPHDGWQQHAGHVDRYEWANKHVQPGEVVNDVACGSGYGSLLLINAGEYRGYDRPGVDIVQAPDHATFHGADLNSAWVPETCDVTVCFETLEHVEDPAYVASMLAATTRRLIAVSVPVVPTAHENHHHLHDFTVSEIPALFPGWTVVEEWAQPEEMSHVWLFGREDV